MPHPMPRTVHIITEPQFATYQHVTSTTISSSIPTFSSTPCKPFDLSACTSIMQHLAKAALAHQHTSPTRITQISYHTTSPANSFSSRDHSSRRQKQAQGREANRSNHVTVDRETETETCDTSTLFYPLLQRLHLAYQDASEFHAGRQAGLACEYPIPITSTLVQSS
ncbi:hypothetical protein IAQ61_003967 [Plenodomus lingam]|uniref:uncharacterized protein n=1 Tax=Leptosphaeria maculans TaxID=5022 RepID=UPI0033285FEF|nr:hypothetical protein IAQ61_003967 [Plenodomus lingam]